MEKNFIKREDLNQIVGELAERMLEHTDEIRMEITIGKDYKGSDVMRVVTHRRDYVLINSQEFQIIEMVSDWMDVAEDVIGCAVEMSAEMKKKEEAQAKAEAEKETEETL